MEEYSRRRRLRSRGSLFSFHTTFVHGQDIGQRGTRGRLPSCVGVVTWDYQVSVRDGGTTIWHTQGTTRYVSWNPRDYKSRLWDRNKIWDKVPGSIKTELNCCLMSLTCDTLTKRRTLKRSDLRHNETEFFSFFFSEGRDPEKEHENSSCFLSLGSSRDRRVRKDIYGQTLTSM